MSSPLTWAQLDDSESYDPFVDFSEFEEVTEEEADLNFFKNGRFFNLGFVGGYRGFTETMSQLYQSDFMYGFYLVYFFDLRFALQISYTTGSHGIDYTSSQGTVVKGSSTLDFLGLNLKYYFNTQNVTRGLAELNPYVVGGFSQVYRTSRVSGQAAFAKDSARSFDVGGGIEIPALRNKMFFGIQGMFHLVNFADENTEVVLNGGAEETGLFPTGDLYTLLLILGINF